MVKKAIAPADPNLWLVVPPVHTTLLLCLGRYADYVAFRNTRMSTTAVGYVACKTRQGIYVFSMQKKEIMNAFK
jgi:hypothetical protein